MGCRYESGMLFLLSDTFPKTIVVNLSLYTLFRVVFKIVFSFFSGAAIQRQGRSYKYWTGGRQVQIGIFFLYRKYEGGVKQSYVSSSCE